MAQRPFLALRNDAYVLEQARRLAGIRRLHLTLTHFHPEHGFGAQVFKAEATIRDETDRLRAAGVDVTVALLPRTAQDRPMHRTRRPVATMRQVLRHRWEMASGIQEFPAFAETMEPLLRKVAGGCQATPLPGYPAFGG
ncbi:hypothetical protein [Streptomyces sp. NPDC001450]